MMDKLDEELFVGGKRQSAYNNNKDGPQTERCTRTLTDSDDPDDYYICTRPVGHDGAHEAGVSDTHIVARWL